jgi:hypothetical protein
MIYDQKMTALMHCSLFRDVVFREDEFFVLFWWCLFVATRNKSLFFCLIPFFFMYASILLLVYYVVAEPGRNWYLRHINIFFLSKKCPLPLSK